MSGWLGLVALVALAAVLVAAWAGLLVVAERAGSTPGTVAAAVVGAAAVVVGQALARRRRR